MIKHTYTHMKSYSMNSYYCQLHDNSEVTVLRLREVNLLKIMKSSSGRDDMNSDFLIPVLKFAITIIRGLVI